jgi:hypothetical protein
MSTHHPDPQIYPDTIPPPENVYGYVHVPFFPGNTKSDKNVY